MAKIMTWFEARDHELFPMLGEHNERTDVVAFRNGYYNYHSRTFSATLDSGVTTHFFDVEWTPTLKDEKTPLWDNLLKTQLKDDDVVKFLEVLIGRLFSPLGHDNWQVAIFLKGIANAGKGTLISLIVDMMPPGATATLSANQEITFGLETVHDKRLFAAPDMPTDMKRTLAPTVLQSMISGETVAVPRKNKGKLDLLWRTHLIFGSNYLPNYDDAAGSISRRLVVFLYETAIETRDPSLKKSIVAGELPSIFLRCVDAYVTYLAKYPDKDILTLMPQKLQDERARTETELDPLRDFVENGSDDYMVRKNVGNTYSWKDFCGHFKVFCKAKTGRGRTLRDTDRATLGGMGFPVQDTWICKSCNDVSSKANCLDHYDAKNRRRVVTIRNIEIERNDTMKYPDAPQPEGTPANFRDHLARRRNEQ